MTIVRETFLASDGKISATLVEHREGATLVQEWVDHLPGGLLRGRANFRVADTSQRTPEAIEAVIGAWHGRVSGGNAQAPDTTIEGARAFMAKTDGWGVLHCQWPPHRI